MTTNSTGTSAGGQWKWLLDDIVLIGFSAYCLAAALGLQVWAGGIEPTFISIFLGVGVAAITYRYLGGTDGA